MNFLGKLWRGEYPLWKTYWVFNLLVNTGFAVVASFITGVSRSVGVGGYAILFPVVVASIVYAFVAIVGLKRSADYYLGNALWKYLAYVVVFLGALSLCMTVVTILNSF